MLDEELTAALNAELKEGLAEVPYLFISSVSGKGIQALKDQLWSMIND